LPPSQKVVEPEAEIVAAVNGFTVIVADTEFVQPFASVMEYVSTAFPAATPDTTPVELIVAAAALLEDHVPPAVVEANTTVDPSHTAFAPVIAAIAGKG
jgi:hypothetical protein